MLQFNAFMFFSFTKVKFKVMTKYQVLIIGGGTAGIMVAAQLKKKNKNISITKVSVLRLSIFQRM